MRFAVIVLSGPVATGAAQGLERLVAEAEALGARTGVAVADGDGRVLWRHRAAEAFTPASNLKVLTATAVLQGLGAQFEFRTEFRLRAGRLCVVASGDPNWCRDGAHDPAAVFDAVARALRARGVRQLAGIDLEPGPFTGPSRPATWPQDQLQTWYCAPTGPFVLEQGTFQLRLAAAGGGQAQVELLAPPAGVPVRGTLPLVERRGNATYGAIDQGDHVLVRGRFPAKGAPVTIRTAVADPAAWYLATMQRCLAAGGVAVGGVAVADAGAGDVLVHVHTSSLREALLRMLEDSSNFDAEQCLRVLGAHTRRDGSLQGGVQALHDEVRRLAGQLPPGVVFADGSGLSRQNRVTPGLLVVAMWKAAQGPVGPALQAALPVAGRSGTLADRFRSSDLAGRVRAKTGWIRGASALTGVVERRDGSLRWFSILMNYDPKQDGRNKDLKRLQEQIVAAIDALDGAR